MNWGLIEKAMSSSKGAGKNISFSSEEERKAIILSLLETLGTIDDRSGREGRSIRRSLRSLGFRLSNPASVSMVKEWKETLA